MGDRFCQTLTIGGDPGRHRAKLRELLDDEFPGEDEMEDAEGLQVSVNEADYSYWSDLRDQLRKWGLSYNHQIEGKYEYNAHVLFWRPGMRECGLCYCLQNGDHVIRLADLEDASARGLTVSEILEKRTPPALPPWVMETVEDSF